MIQKIIKTQPEASTVLIRCMVGAVFLSEGLQKYLEPSVRGAGRFEKIGLPAPELLGQLVGGLEVLCGALLLLGLLTRLAVLPLLGIMAVALLTTKVPILLEKGFWEMAHAARTDFCMVMGSLFLLFKGSGAASLDASLSSPQPVQEAGHEPASTD